jgi:hypothetical protein
MYRKPYVRWYDENPDKVGAVRITQGGKLLGRALIWATDQETVVVDRVYPSDNGPHTNALHDWCNRNGYVYKTQQSSDDGCLSDKQYHYTVTMKRSSSGLYPYLDTFKYTDDDPEHEDLITLNLDHGEYNFNCTGGGYEGQNRTSCEGCGCVVDEDDARYVDNYGYYCERCYDEHFVYLEYQLPNGNWVELDYNRDNCTECEHCNGWRRSRDTEDVRCGRVTERWCAICVDAEATSCNECGDVRPVEDMHPIDGDGCYCEACFDEKCDECEECGEYALNREMLKDSDDRILCADCCTDEDATPLAEAPTTPAAATPVAQSEEPRSQLVYPSDEYPSIHSADIPTLDCRCHNCVGVRTRREREFRASHWVNDRCDCDRCIRIRAEMRSYINAPYPTERERNEIADAATRTTLASPASQGGLSTSESIANAITHEAVMRYLYTPTYNGPAILEWLGQNMPSRLPGDFIIEPITFRGAPLIEEPLP